MVNDLINDILPSIEHFRIGGYWIAFFAALLETTIGIGLFLPGSTIILFLGALSARGYLDTGDLLILGGILYFFKWLIIRKGKQFLIIPISLWQSIKEAVINNEHVVLWMQEHPRSISFLQARLDTTAFSGLTLSILTLAFV